MVLNIIETANATDFITSQGIYRVFAPKSFDVVLVIAFSILDVMPMVENKVKVRIVL